MTEKTPSSSRTEDPASLKDVPVMVSACLLGVRCRYDGGERGSRDVIEFAPSARVIPICPEQLGGLPTPRSPASILGGDGNDVLAGRARVVTAEGRDVTGEFRRGAEASLDLARLMGATVALLKDGSPSCGLRLPDCQGASGPGTGVTAALFRRSGIRVMEISPETGFQPSTFLEFLQGA